MDEHRNDERLDEILDLAAKWQERATGLITPKEKASQKRLQQLILHPLDKAFLTKLIDQCFRSNDVVRMADQITYLLKRSSIPDFFSLWEVLLMWLFLNIGHRFPRISVPLMIEKIRKDSGQSIIPGEPKILTDVLKQLRREKIRMNLTRLGSAVLGQEEANRRVTAIIEDLKHPAIDYISLKVSSICPQVQPLAFDSQLEILIEQLSRIFRVAASQHYTDFNGQQAVKFVNLDIESFSELEITSQAFMKTLDQEEFQSYSAGIALQAYLPESIAIQQQLTQWAHHRTTLGGSAIKLRIVKGANLEMEKIEASLNGWPLAPYSTKIEVDANFKRMIDFGLQEPNFRSVRLGIASHNIFELAYARLSTLKTNATEFVDFEMLYGIAGHIQRAIRDDSENLVLYAPVAKKNEFIHAVGYLIRRLDENTAKDNFLRYANGLTTHSREWHILQDLFIASCEQKNRVGNQSHRTQNRSAELLQEKTGTYHLGKFDNEPVTDWSLPVNREWARMIRKQWMKRSPDSRPTIPLVVNGEEIKQDREQATCWDPSLLPEKYPVCTICLGQENDVEQALLIAKTDPDRWRETTPNERHRLLSIVAQNMRRRRADLIGATVATTGRVLSEIDKEISQAIDYIEYYPFSLKPFIEPRHLQSRGKGVGIVLSSKITAIASPCNGITAALASGNTVILNPAPEAVLPAWLLCECYWQAGISLKTLQFLPGKDFNIGFKLAIDPRSDFVILDNTTRTARQLQAAKPGITLCAQTGGKNAIIVTSVSDKDEAIRHIIDSAFHDGGQKTSAVSLLILEKEVFHDSRFKQLLVDAAASLQIGSAWQFETRIGPLSGLPQGDLLRALTTLEPGESWALKPKPSDSNPLLWTPGIKWNVTSDSFTHRTEFFGPVLGVLCAETFQHAIRLVNQTELGATSGLECLDKRKQEFWKSAVKAGNLYINGQTSNAFVLRQPFGGWGKSIFGHGLKTGGPNYVSQFMDFMETGSPAEIATKYDRRLLVLAKNWMRKTDRSEFKEFQTDIQKSVRAMNSYQYHARHKFKMELDLFHLRGQDNTIRYLPIEKIIIRVHPADSLFEILARIAAAQAAGCKVTVSIPDNLESSIIAFLKKRERREVFRHRVKITEQSDDQLIAALNPGDRIRYAGTGKVPQLVYQAAAELGLYITANPVFMEGRIELLNYYRSQSICHNYHRYGNLGARAFDQSLNAIRPFKV